MTTEAAMGPFEVSVRQFNDFVTEYAARFSDIGAYLPAVDRFCSLVDKNRPRILELACGPGNFTRYIKNRFPESEYIATDLAPLMIEFAGRQVMGVDFRVMDMRDILQLSGTFDAIFCSFGLPFLSRDDAMKLVADCSHIMNPGGVIYFSTMEGDDSMAGFEPTSFSGDAKVYFNYHRQNDMEEAFGKNGLIIGDLRRQAYADPGGGILTDLIVIGTKKKG